MSGELSSILDHIEKIEELDLDGVEPTSHVVNLENVLRPDKPRPSWPRDKILDPAPDAGDGGFRVPSPGGWASCSPSPPLRRPSASRPVTSQRTSCSTRTASAPPPTT